MPIAPKRFDIALIVWLAVVFILGVWASWPWRALTWLEGRGFRLHQRRLGV